VTVIDVVDVVPPLVNVTVHVREVPVWGPGICTAAGHPEASVTCELGSLTTHLRTT
jgi:hypothetical protein